LVKIISWEFIIFGIVIGADINALFTHPQLITSNLILAINATILIVGIVGVLFFLWHNFRGVKKRERSRQLRFFFLGLSIASFLFALSDFVQYYLGNDPHIKVTDNPPILWFGGSPITSVLSSFLLGAMLSLVERLIEVIEKKDI
jgi:hypothetical protein